MDNASKRHKGHKTPYFTEEDVKLCQLWTTCPISEHADKIKLINNDPCKGPEDIYLVLDSLFFTKGVEEDDFDLAYWCYNGLINQVSALRDGTDRITMLKRFLGQYYK